MKKLQKINSDNFPKVDINEESKKLNSLKEELLVAYFPTQPIVKDYKKIESIKVSNPSIPILVLFDGKKPKQKIKLKTLFSKLLPKDDFDAIDNHLFVR